MYTQPLLDAIAESERLVKEASFIESEADLLEGLQYLAGCVAACTHVAFDYDRDHPFLHSGTGPFTKMGLDNPPDTMYFGTRVVAGHEYVVTGKRGDHHRRQLPAPRRRVHRRGGPPRQRDRVRRPQARHRDRRHIRVAIHPPGHQRAAGDSRGVQRLVSSAGGELRDRTHRHRRHRTAAADQGIDRKTLGDSG